jgi:parallel beta-helix repeat protein
VTIGGNRTLGTGPLGEGNLISGNGNNGIYITGPSTAGNIIEGNYIGVNLQGTAAFGNGDDGVHISEGAHHNTIGVERETADCTVPCNVISGNGSNGIIIVGEAHHNEVLGNFIGTDRTGTFAIGGQPGGGVDLASGAQHNTIGGERAPADCTGPCNVISGNGVDGIFIADAETQLNTIQGNYIGTNISGTTAIPNTPWGLFILNWTSNNLITDNLISGNTGHGLEITYSAFGNEIRENQIVQNGGAGIHFIEGACQHTVISNTITNNQNGVHVDGTSTLSHTITANSIFGNTGKGILLTNGGNGGILSPTIVTATWRLAVGTASPNAKIEVFSDDDGEGRLYEGSTTADDAGDFAFTKGTCFRGPYLTATATDSNGNTSEFSQPVATPVCIYLPLILKYPLLCDPYEPNDAPPGWGPLVSDQNYQAKLCWGDDEDYYYFTITSLDNVVINLDVPATVDYHMWLYHESDTVNPVGSSANIGKGIDEHIDYTPTMTGTYYIRIRPRHEEDHDDVNAYTLVASLR